MASKASAKNIRCSSGNGKQAGLLEDDEKTIMEQIRDTHAPDGTKLDVKTLLNIVTNILNRASHIVDGALTGTQAHLEKVEDKPYQSDFEAPCPIIEKLSCEMMCNCKASDPVDLHETTLSMFGKLSIYSWDTKVVLALSAYAVNYGDFWLLEQLYPKDQLAKPMAVLKGMCVLDKPTGPLKNRIEAIKKLTKAILEVTECIVETEKLLAKNTLKDVPALAKAMDEIPKAVYLTIKTVIACASQITSLTTTVDESHTSLLLSSLDTKLNMTLSVFKDLSVRCDILIQENNRFDMLIKLTSMTHTDNVEVLKAIIYTENDMLIDLSTKTQVKIDCLRKKRVLLCISGLDISTETITTLKQTYIARGQEQNSFEVVWIPVVEQWSEESQTRFEVLKAEMEWHTVHNFSAIDSVVLKFFKQEWNYQGKPIVPVLSNQATVESRNALHIIQLGGIKAFPFTDATQIKMWEEHKKFTIDLVIGHGACDIHQELTTWIKTEQVILFYGGTDTEWMTNLKGSADCFLKGTGKDTKVININSGHARFWDRVNSLLLAKMAHVGDEVDEVLHETHKLYRYKKEQKWGMLCIGSKLLISVNDDSIVTVLQHQDTSKWDVETDLGMAILEVYKKVSRPDPCCCHYDFPATVGKVPETLKCYLCSRVMERFITFSCCHKDKGAGASNGSC